jgi:hypothetical protein
MSTDYDKLSDRELRLMAVNAMEWDQPHSDYAWFNPIDDARDLRHFREHFGFECEFQRHKGGCAFRVFKLDWYPWVYQKHNSSRDSIIRAEARATIIAILKAVEATAQAEVGR